MHAMVFRGLVLGLLVSLQCPAAPVSGLADRLPEKPCGFGRPASDRAWWGALAKSPEAAVAMKAAESWLKEPMPAFDGERYLDYLTNGDRIRYQAIHGRRWDRFKRLVMGECLEGKGRFVPAISETVASLCSEPSWILPAHDEGAAVFKGASPYVDLSVAANGYQMAQAAWMLDGSLPEETLAMMRENVAKRLTGPVLKTIDGTAPKNVRTGHWWMKITNNWNAVCTAGALGAILATEPSREVRAKAVEWARGNADVFLSGFGKDGYCSEGLGYWNYGFWHFAVLAELLRTHTRGEVDLYRLEEVRVIAEAPVKLEIADGVFPSFADCSLGASPDADLLELTRWRLDARPFSGSLASPLAASPPIYQTLMVLAARAETASADPARKMAQPLRSWFSDSGVFVARPGSADAMAAAWKGGHNNEHHNHNDVGTTVIVWKGRQVITDPGAMVYRAETFGKDRYKLPIMGSFGHSVPVVAGLLQQAGAECRGRVLETSFNESGDSMTMDLSSAYPGADLRTLTRRWDYQRRGDGMLLIEDRFAFEKPSTFGTALLTPGDWYFLDAGDRSARFLADGGDGAVLRVDVTFSAAGAWEARSIRNPGKPEPVRLGLALSAPALEGYIRMTVRPAAVEDLAKAAKMRPGTLPEKLADARKAP